MRNAQPILLAACSFLTASLAHADIPQPEVPDFRGYESTSFLQWNDWTNLIFFGPDVSGAEPEVSVPAGAFGRIVNPIAFLDAPAGGEICSTSTTATVDYAGVGPEYVKEVVVQIGGPDAALVDCYLRYPDFPDPEALSHVEARDLPGGGKLFRFLASPSGGGFIGTFSQFTGFSLVLSLPGSSGPLCLDEVLLDVRHGLESSIDAVCAGATVNSLLVQASTDLGGSSVAADNVFELTASGIPAGSFGLFLASRGLGSTPCSGSCIGSLCLDPTDVGRLNPALGAGLDLSFEMTLDLTGIATNPVMPALAGQDWYFQAWYRDTDGGAPVSRFTDAAGVTFQ